MNNNCLYCGQSIEKGKDFCYLCEQKKIFLDFETDSKYDAYTSCMHCGVKQYTPAWQHDPTCKYFKELQIPTEINIQSSWGVNRLDDKERNKLKKENKYIEETIIIPPNKKRKISFED